MAVIIFANLHIFYNLQILDAKKEIYKFISWEKIGNWVGLGWLGWVLPWYTR